MLFHKQISSLVRKAKNVFDVKEINWSSICIWVVGVVLLATLTLFDFLPLLAEYRHNNVATQITVTKGERLPKPNISFCMYYHSAALLSIAERLNGDRSNASGSGSNCLSCQAMENNSWDVWNRVRLDSNRTVTEGALATMLLSKLFEEGSFDEAMKLRPSNFNWNEAIFDSVWTYFACTTHQDIKSTINLSNERFFGDPCEGLELSTIPHISRRDTDRLFGYLLDLLSLYLKIQIVTSDGKVQEDRLEDRKEELTIKGAYFCLALRQNTSRETFTLTPFPEDISPPWVRSQIPNTFTVYADKRVLYSFIDVHKRLYPHDLHSENENEQQVAIGYSLRSRVIETRPNVPCHKDNTHAVICLAKHQLAKATEECRCVPFIHRYLNRDDDHDEGQVNLPYCNITLYASCRDKLQQGVEASQEKCRHKCEYPFYEWKHFTYAVYKQDSLARSYQINVTEMKTPFIEFKIMIKDSPEKFLSQVGGVVNLYLGTSGVSVCALIVYCVDRIKRRYRTKHGGSVGSNDLGLQSGISDMAQSYPQRQQKRDFSGGEDISTVREEMEKLKQEIAGMIKQEIAGMIEAKLGSQNH